MKSFLPLLSLVVVFTSCSTAFKAGQTPDDVYFSPERPVEADTRVRNYRNEEREVQEYYSYTDERYLRMRVRNRNRWSAFDDYYTDPHAYTYYSYYRNYNMNPRLYWNCHYSPYGPAFAVVSQQSPVYNKPRVFNLGAYYPAPTGGGKPSNAQTRRTFSVPTNVSTSTRNTGNALRGLFGIEPTESTRAASSSGSSGSSSSGSSNNSSSSGSSSSNNGNAPVRRF